MLDSFLFPHTVHYDVNEHYGEAKSGDLRQVTIKIDDELFAVVNCSLTDGEWDVPRFIILRGILPRDELELLHEIVDVVQVVTVEIQKPTATATVMKELLRQFA